MSVAALLCALALLVIFGSHSDCPNHVWVKLGPRVTRKDSKSSVQVADHSRLFEFPGGPEISGWGLEWAFLQAGSTWSSRLELRAKQVSTRAGIGRRLRDLVGVKAGPPRYFGDVRPWTEIDGETWIEYVEDR